ncbi:MAG: ACT domain-containing protein [Anaerolineaceae bacterium]|nr:MAG: ACT domain-containing protein [Anaerolineaceae bacterium]
MAKDLTVILEDRPGTLADLGEALGAAGINIDGMCGIPCEGKGVIHILVEDAAGARGALEAGGFEVSAEREVLLLEVENRPGSLGETARKIANAGVNIETVYVASNNRLVVGVDNLEQARATL